MKNAKTYLPVPSADGTKAEHSEAAAVAAGHPDPEVVARAKRRIFTGEYKQRVLAEPMRPKRSPVALAPFSGGKACTPLTCPRGGTNGRQESATP